MATATAMSPTSVLVIAKNVMIRVLHAEHKFSDRFIKYMLARHIIVDRQNYGVRRVDANTKAIATVARKGQPCYVDLET